MRARSGKVVDEDDHPVGGALVIVANVELGSEVATTTDSNGLFTLDLAPRTDLMLEVRADSYETTRLYAAADSTMTSLAVANSQRVAEFGAGIE